MIFEDDDIFGDGVNVAARLQELAEPGGICVSRAVRDQVQVGDRFDVAFEDLGEQSVKNIARPIPAFRVRLDGGRAGAGRAEPAPATAAADAAKKPSIAVLPFANMSGDPEQEFFADGLTEDIITALSRFRELFVISRNSAFVYKGKAVKIQDVAAELGVQYVVEGSVRKAGNRVRVTVQLIDAPSDRHVWAERYDRDLEDIFAIQDEVTAAIVATLPGRIEAATHDRRGAQADREHGRLRMRARRQGAPPPLGARGQRRGAAHARPRDRARPEIRPRPRLEGLRARPGLGLRLVRGSRGDLRTRSARSCRSRSRSTTTRPTCIASSPPGTWPSTTTTRPCTIRSGRSASTPTTT